MELIKPSDAATEEASFLDRVKQGVEDLSHRLAGMSATPVLMEQKAAPPLGTVDDSDDDDEVEDGEEEDSEVDEPAAEESEEDFKHLRPSVYEVDRQSRRMSGMGLLAGVHADAEPLASSTEPSAPPDNRRPSTVFFRGLDAPAPEKASSGGSRRLSLNLDAARINVGLSAARLSSIGGSLSSVKILPRRMSQALGIDADPEKRTEKKQKKKNKKKSDGSKAGAISTAVPESMPRNVEEFVELTREFAGAHIDLRARLAPDLQLNDYKALAVRLKLRPAMAGREVLDQSWPKLTSVRNGRRNVIPLQSFVRFALRDLEAAHPNKPLSRLFFEVVGSRAHHAAPLREQGVDRVQFRKALRSWLGGGLGGGLGEHGKLFSATDSQLDEVFSALAASGDDPEYLTYAAFVTRLHTVGRESVIL